MSKESIVAEKAVREAGKVVLRHYGKKFGVRKKGVKDYVSEIDLKSEQAIFSVIRKAFPGHGFISEEAGEINGAAEEKWVVDPIDGTNNFISGIDYFAVLLALQRGEDLVLGAVFDPVRDELFLAEKGNGAFLNGKRLHVKPCTLEESIVAVDFGHSHDIRIFRKTAGIASSVGAIRSLGSTLSSCYIACNRLQGVLGWNMKPWDFAAPSVIIGEAGGKSFNHEGKPWRLNEKKVVTGSAGLCRQMLGHLK